MQVLMELQAYFIVICYRSRYMQTTLDILSLQVSTSKYATWDIFFIMSSILFLSNNGDIAFTQL